MYPFKIKMSLFQSLCHYIIFALQVACFAFMNLVLSVAVAIVTTGMIGWIVGCVAVAVGCLCYWSWESESRRLYPYSCPTPKY